MKSGFGQSEALDPATAALEAAERALERAQISCADGALVLQAQGQKSLDRKTLARLRDALGTPEIVGGEVHSLAGSGISGPGASVAVAVFSAEACGSFALDPELGSEGLLDVEVEAALSSSLSSRDLVFALVDPIRVDARRLFGESDAGPEGPLVLGLGAAPDGALWHGGESGSPVVGLAIRCRKAPEIRLAQGCRPVSEVMTVTRARGHWIDEIEDRPALDVYREQARAPLAEDLRRATQILALGVPALGARAPGVSDVRDETTAFAQGCFTNRIVTGFDTDRRALATSEQVRSGGRIAFVLRDAGLAREELHNALTAIDAESALILRCALRGERLFGHEGLEEGYFERALRPTPWLSAAGAFPVAPVGSAHQIIHYAAVLALLEPNT